MENVYEGKDIDLLSLPVPHWHEEDGGRYMGTAHLVITRDIDEGWVNIGCYRVMVHDNDTLALYISPGKHGRIMRQKYFDQGRPCPVAISFGDDPLLLMTAANQPAVGQIGIRLCRRHPRPSRRRHSRQTHRPADSGLFGNHHRRRMLSRPNQIREGPYGEWTGYYASGERTEPIIKVKRLMHRTNPIITGAPSSRPPGGSDDGLVRSAFIWDHMDKAGVPDVRGVGCYQGRFFTAVSIKQRYPGHAKQAAIRRRPVPAPAPIWAATSSSSTTTSTSTIMNDVLWAMCTRVDPASRHRFHPPRLERPARPGDPQRSKRLQHPRHHRRHPALRMDQGLSESLGFEHRDEGTGGQKIWEIF